jgi:ferric-dicitrate binding protein FerR (iron transport regulator)
MFKKANKKIIRKALFILIVAMLLYYFPKTIYNRYLNEELMPITEMSQDIDTLVVLPDGSKVFLEKGSSITFTKEFPIDRRKTELRGGASVHIDEDIRPFKMKIKRCLLISNKGKLLVKKTDHNSYEVIVETGDFTIETYNKEGNLEYIYTKTAGDSVLIGEYVQEK